MVDDDNDRNPRARGGAPFLMDDPRRGRGDSGDGRRDGPERPDERPRADGPPDLDELWRDFNRRLNNLFRRRGAPGSGGGTPNGDRSGGLGFGIVVGLLFAIYLGSGVFIVQAGQAGVVLQFGRYAYTATPGIQWRLPYPFQSDEIINLAQVRSVEIGHNNTIRSANLKDSSMLTQDENIIDVRFAVQYRIKDPADFLFNNADPEAAVTQAAETAVREIVGKNKMDYVLYEGREAVGQQLSESIQRILDSYKTGILVTSVTMQSVQPPEQVQAAFDDAVKATQDRERQKNEAQAYANDVVPRAAGDAKRMIAEAQGYSASVVAQAQGDADRFKQVYAEYAKAPAVTRERMYLDTMQQIYSNAGKVLVDSRNGNSLLYLPLDKLLEQNKARAAGAPPQQQREAPAQGAAASGTTPAPPGAAAPDLSSGADDPLRSRELLRDRSRQDDVR